MVILGLLLILLALVVGAALITGTSAPEVSGQDVDIQLLDTVTITLNPLTLVIAGMAAMFVLWLGLVITKAALARKARLRRERKATEAEARELRERQAAEDAERARLAEGERQLEERRLAEEQRRTEEQRAAEEPQLAEEGPGTEQQRRAAGPTLAEERPAQSGTDTRPLTREDPGPTGTTPREGGTRP